MEYDDVYHYFPLLGSPVGRTKVISAAAAGDEDWGVSFACWSVLLMIGGSSVQIHRYTDDGQIE